MVESLNLTSADQATAGTTKYQVKNIFLLRGLEWNATTSALVANPSSSEVVIQLMGEGGLMREERILGVVADNLIKMLNTANMSTSSLQKRTLQWLAANRPIPGSVSGTPDA